MSAREQLERARDWKRVAVLGGSFDPPHVGHVLLATYVLSVGNFDGIVILPTHTHAFGKVMTSFAHRLAMSERAFAVLDRTRCIVSSLEAELPSPSFTVHTLEALHAALPQTSMRLVVGADILPSAHKWREIERVRALAPFFVVGRAGFESVSDAHAELIQVSSTEMRQKLAAAEDVTSWMSSSVRAYIAEHGLYGA